MNRIEKYLAMESNFGTVNQNGPVRVALRFGHFWWFADRFQVPQLTPVVEFCEKTHERAHPESFQSAVTITDYELI